LLQLDNQYISVSTSGFTDSIEGRILRTGEGTVILTGVFGTRIIPVCSINSVDHGPFAYALFAFNDVITVINTATNTIMGFIPVGDSPNDIVFTPDGTRAYVTNFSDDNVQVIDTASHTVIGLPIPGYTSRILLTARSLSSKRP
jgi:YVTN family beta-propeller protein